MADLNTTGLSAFLPGCRCSGSPARRPLPSRGTARHSGRGSSRRPTPARCTRLHNEGKQKKTYFTHPSNVTGRQNNVVPDFFHSQHSYRRERAASGRARSRRQLTTLRRNRAEAGNRTRSTSRWWLGRRRRRSSARCSCRCLGTSGKLSTSPGSTARPGNPRYRSTNSAGFREWLTGRPGAR